MVRAERSVEKRDSAAESLARRQRARRMMLDASLEGDGLTMGGFALVVLGAIADSFTAIDVGLVGMAVGLAMRFGALNEKSKKK